MAIQYLVIYLSMFFWIFPAVKQYRTELFWYFLLYALMDPIRFVLIKLYAPSAIYTYGSFLFFLLLSILWPFREKLSTRLLFTAAVIPMLITLFISPMKTIYPQIFIHLIITYFFMTRTFLFTANSGKVNIFHLFLLMEEVSIILKFLAVVIDIKTGTGYFYATGAFQILIAIFFTLYREDNKKLHIDLRSN